MDESLRIPGARPEGCSRNRLQRLRAGELSGQAEAEARAHLASCPGCARVDAELAAEAEEFAREVPFERLAAGVAGKQRQARRRQWAGPLSLALAAGVAAVVLAGPIQAVLEGERGRNALKGGAELQLFVGGAGAQPRLASEGEALSAGERVRVGYVGGPWRYVLVLSIDEAGQVTPLYPESGASLEVQPGTQLMPDSLELTGSGWERILAVFADRPLQVEDAAAAARAELARAGSLRRMGPLPLGGAQSSRLLRKP